MARFSTIDEKDAPARPKTAGRLRERMRIYESYVAEVGRGKVGVLTPEDGESPRGLSLRINRAARRTEADISTWIVGSTVYFSHNSR